MKRAAYRAIHCCFAAIWCILAAMSIITITLVLCFAGLAAAALTQLEERKQPRLDAGR